MDILKGDIAQAMQGTLKDAFDQVLVMASDGEPMAQYAIGLFYFWGDMLLNFQKPSKEDFAQCEKQNAAEALKWFRLSAEQGCIPSFRNAFNSVRNGVNGVTKDPEEALRWAETVADRVDMRTYYYSMVSEYHKLGRHADALRWSERGDREGIVDCTVDLGLSYLEKNRGVTQDRAKALFYFKKAADMGGEYGYYNAGRCYYNGWGTDRDYREAVRYFEEGMRLGHYNCKWFLAYCYFYGWGTEQNYEKAASMMKSLELSHKEYPKELMGYCCLYGKGVNPDYVRAKRLLEEAAKANTPAAYKFLGDMYDQALGVPENLNMAVACYQKASALGIADAAEELNRFKKTIFGKWKRK